MATPQRFREDMDATERATATADAAAEVYDQLDDTERAAWHERHGEWRRQAQRGLPRPGDRRGGVAR